MNRLLSCLVPVLLAAVLSRADEPAMPPLQFSPTDRIMVLAPHPDDEVIGTGGIIQQAVKQGLPVHVVFYTYGDNNEWAFAVYREHPVFMPRAMQGMGMIRHDEAIRADAMLGLSPTNLTFLGYPDFGTMNIWDRHWNDRKPFRSMLTRVTAVPYTNAFRYGAPYKGEEILRDLTTLIRDFKPTKIFVSHPADHNGDHLSLYLFTQVALWDLEQELKPEVFPYLVHYVNWPRPRSYAPDVPLTPPERFKTSVQWCADELTPTNVVVKHNAIRMHASQYAVSEDYLDSFVRPNELFGDFSVLKLTQVSPSNGPAVENDSNSDGIPDYLTGKERDSYIGIETRSIWLEGDSIVFVMTLSRPLVEAVEFHAAAFGYRKDTPFAAMPKIRIAIDVTGYRILDQDRPLPKESFQVTRNMSSLTIRLPLSTLGYPERILTRARTSLGEVGMDWLSWRILEVQQVKK